MYPYQGLDPYLTILTPYIEIAFLTEPTQIPGTNSFVQVSAGQDFSLALELNGNVWSFGKSASGRLGLGENLEEAIFSPTKITTLPEIKSISANRDSAIVLDHSGSVW
jgi:alpha-tubulin suppressor-like RCC1 family protein